MSAIETLIDKINNINIKTGRHGTDLLARFKFCDPESITYDANSTEMNHNDSTVWMQYSVGGSLIGEYNPNYYTHSIDISEYPQKHIIYRGYLPGGDNVDIRIGDESGYSLLFTMSGDANTRTIEIPSGAKMIYFPVHKSSTVDFSISLYSTLFFIQELDVTDFIIDQDSIIIKQERDNLSGVSISVSSEIRFVNEARDLITAFFMEYKLWANLGLRVYLRDPIDIHKYELAESLKLDFKDLVIEDDVASIGSEVKSIQEYVKSGGKSKFDIPVSEIKKDEAWDYNRIELQSIANYTIAEMQYDNVYLSHFFGISLNSVERVPDSVEHTAISQVAGDATSESYFFKTKEGGTFYIKSKFRIYSSKPGTFFRFRRWSDISSGFTIYEKAIDIPTGNDDWYYADINMDITYSTTADIEFLFQADYPTGGSSEYSFRIDNFEYMSVVWRSIGNPIQLDIIEPEILLQRLLNNISNKRAKLTGVINWDISYLPMLIAAETLRGFSDANIHISLNDFIDWMKFKGYEYQYENNTIIFDKRDNLYLDIEALYLSEDDVSSLKLLTNDNFAYTGLKIGYEKKDYDQSVNGAFEFNGTFDYLTDMKSQTTNLLEIISPLRADSLGLEFLCWKRFETSTDNKNDNDVFEVAMLYDSVNDKYILDNSVPVSVNGSVLFNGVLNPKEIIKLNVTLIGISLDKLRFTGTTSYRDITVPSYDMYSDVEMVDKLFEPYQFSFDTGNFWRLPDASNRNGYVKFKYRGFKYKGFIFSIEKRPVKEQASEWILLAIEE